MVCQPLPQQQFEIDTGAVTVNPVSAYMYMYDQIPDGPLLTSTRVLRGPAGHVLRVCGVFKGKLRNGHTEAEQEIYVVQGLHKALLGRPAIESLHVVAQVAPITTHKCEVVAQYPHLFKGLGCLQGAYHIKLKGDSRPLAFTTPRRVPIPLRPKMKAELERMETLGVISKVEEPTDWCKGMAKADRRVRICVDLTKLNESVQHEQHILPSVEETLAQLGEATLFSKLDANSGFWQIELSRD